MSKKIQNYFQRKCRIIFRSNNRKSRRNNQRVPDKCLKENAQCNPKEDSLETARSFSKALSTNPQIISKVFSNTLYLNHFPKSIPKKFEREFANNILKKQFHLQLLKGIPKQISFLFIFKINARKNTTEKKQEIPNNSQNNFQQKKMPQDLPYQFSWEFPEKCRRNFERNFPK